MIFFIIFVLAVIIGVLLGPSLFSTRLKVKRLTPTAKLPTYGTPGSGCFDFYIDSASAPKKHKTDPNAMLYGTGLAFQIPKGKVLMIYSRSGHGFKDGVRLSNCVGVIDSDYRQEVMISLRTDSPELKEYNAGERIAQGMIIDAPKVKFCEVDQLNETSRSGGLGSTGA